MWIIQNDDMPWTEGDSRVAVEEGEEFGAVQELFSIQDSDDDLVPVCYVPWEPLASDEVQNRIRSRAKLIAAAPELLEACEDVREVLRGMLCDARSNDEADQIDEQLQKLGAAIAKASNEVRSLPERSEGLAEGRVGE